MQGKMFERWYDFCLLVLRLFYLNFLWALFTLLGLIYFGIGPATVAMLAVIRQIICKDETIKVFPQFWKAYKEHFKEAFLLGIAYSFAGIVLITNILTVPTFYSRVFFKFISFFYVVSLLYIGPIMVSFNIEKIGLRVKSSLIFAIGYLQYTLVLVACLLVAYFLILTNVGLFLFLGASIGAYITMWFTHQVFMQVEIQLQVDEGNG